MADDWTERLREMVDDVKYLHTDLLDLIEDPDGTPVEQSELADAAAEAQCLRWTLEGILRRREGK